MKNELIVEGDNILLKRVSLADITDEYLAWLNDDEVTKGLETVPKPYTFQMLERYIKDVLASESTYKFMVLDKISGKSIGTAKIHSISKKNGTCNLGIMIGDKNYWGKGYGHDAYTTAVDFAFDKLGIRKIWEMVDANNVSSLAIFKKTGFQIEGYLKEQSFSDGKYVDKAILGLFAKDRKK